MKKYSEYEEQLRTTITLDEAVNLIQSLGGKYDPNLSDFDAYDQLMVCQSISEAETDTNRKGNANAYVSGNGNDIYKRSVNFELTENRIKAINELKNCDYKTSPLFIGDLLENLFQNNDTKQGHWLRIAQRYPPRRINQTINQMIKRQSGGWITIKNPAAYFTRLIQYRKPRKLASINGINKLNVDS